MSHNKTKLKFNKLKLQLQWQVAVGTTGRLLPAHAEHSERAGPAAPLVDTGQWQLSDCH